MRLESSRQSNNFQGTVFREPGYAALDLDADVSNGRYTLRLFAKNVTDERAFDSISGIRNALTGAVRQGQRRDHPAAHRRRGAWTPSSSELGGTSRARAEKSAPMRIFCAGLNTETNTFIPQPTGLRGLRDRRPASRRRQHRRRGGRQSRRAGLARSWRRGMAMTSSRACSPPPIPPARRSRAVYEQLRDEILARHRRAGTVRRRSAVPPRRHGRARLSGLRGRSRRPRSRAGGDPAPRSGWNSIPIATSARLWSTRPMPW